MVRPGAPTPLWGAAAKAGYALSCVAAALVLAISGFSYFVVHEVSTIGGSHAIASGPSIGAQNILLIGLESRTDWQGNILPNDVLKALHACNRQEIEDGCGGNATNTLILIHIPAGGKKAVGVSIPRDDWVTFADTLGTQQIGKIDQAYGVSMAARESQLTAQDPGISQDQLAFEGNEAGRAATVATVEALTGVHIDHFAELNLDGFYELAKVLGGVEVCLNHPVPYDQNSGFSAAHAGLQHLDAKMALAFVRQRDGLANGDLDRTHRQQAFLDSVLHQLRSDGVLDDLTKVSALLSVAKQYLITDAGWNLLDFITQMRSLTSGNLTFYTLPIVGYADHRRPGRQRGRPQLHPAVRAPAVLRAAALVALEPAPAAHRHGESRPDHGGRLQRRQHRGPGRPGVGGPGQRRLQGGQGRQHQPAHRDRGAVRPGLRGERGQDRGAVQRDRHGELDGRGRPRGGPARRVRHAAERERDAHPVGLVADGASHHRAGGRRGQRGRWHPLRQLG